MITGEIKNSKTQKNKIYLEIKINGLRLFSDRYEAIKENHDKLSNILKFLIHLN